MCFKYFKKPRFKIKSIQEIKQECKFIKARQLVDSFSTPPICRGLRISESNSDFLGIRESVYGSSFLLTLTYKRIVLRAIKRYKSCTSTEQTLFKQIVTGDKVLDLVHLYLLKKLMWICTVGFCDQAFS